MADVLDLQVDVVGRRTPRATLANARLAFPPGTVPVDRRIGLLVRVYAVTYYKLANSVDATPLAVGATDCDDQLDPGTHVLPLGPGIDPFWTGELSVVEIASRATS